MARRRKRPPQESIDSILLAMSRRDDLDDETLIHYFDRLDEEWETGALEKVLHLLRSKDAAAHSAAVLILSELATDDNLEELEDFITDPTVTDLAKLTLAPLLKELGSEMADDGILPYLNDPEAAMTQMQSRLLELVEQSELGVELVLGDVMEMPTERRFRFIDWLGSSQDPRAAHLLVPLLENSSTKMVLAAIDALEELGTITVQQAIPALNYLLGTSSNRSVKQRAREALGRLTMQAVPGVEVEAMQAKRSQRLPLYEARVSFIFGSGSQMILFSWRRPDGLLKGVSLLYQDQWGIKECYGTDEIDADLWAAQMEEQGLGSFSVPIEYARSLVAEARAVNKRTRHHVPVAYAIWRPFIEDEEMPRAVMISSTRAIALEPAQLTPEALQLAEQHGGELIDMDEFSSWLFEPFESLHPYINRYWTNFALADLAQSQGNRSKSGRGRGQGRGNKEISQEQQQLLEDAVSEALADLIDEQWRALYEARMRRQALLLQLADRKKDASLVQAVAAVLHPASGVPAQEQSFLRAMMRLSIQQGPIRMLAAALESGQRDSGPVGLFSLDED